MSEIKTTADKIMDAAKLINRAVSPQCLLEVAGLKNDEMPLVRNLILAGQLNLTIDWKVGLP